MNGGNVCAMCEWWSAFGGVCINAASVHYGETFEAFDGCGDWTEWEETEK